jgi:hypothetical protein
MASPQGNSGLAKVDLRKIGTMGGPVSVAAWRSGTKAQQLIIAQPGW